MDGYLHARCQEASDEIKAVIAAGSSTAVLASAAKLTGTLYSLSATETL
jgi:hypothetical protein